MKNLIISLLTLLLFLFPSPVFAQVIITSPVDSRPISTDYLKNLADIAGDSFICVDKKNLDFYSAVDKNNYKGSSENVRAEIRDIVGKNNSGDASVIINTSTYLNSGLVSSRCGIDYKDTDKGLNDLYSLITEYREPAYYINLSMPRTLPETRLNRIWKDNEKLPGLGQYYIKHNPDSPLKEHIVKSFGRVAPAQYLLEYGYVENKKAELGEDALEDWELDFYQSAKNQSKYFPYKSDLYNYKLPYRSVSEIFSTLIKWQDEGLIDEIIISNDDFQLPEFIIYLFNNTEEPFPAENGQPIKFSYARTYMTSGLLSLINQLTLKRGADETYRALNSRSENINFIFGLDEIPQLIYARDLSKRANLSTDFNIKTEDDKNNIDKFDVIGVNDLLKNAVSFVSYSSNKTDKALDLYLYNYNYTTQSKINNTICEIENSLESMNNASLIEIYSPQLLNTGENLLFQALLENRAVTALTAYSAWNTNANAIGLGVAHSQVAGISEQTTEKSDSFVKAQTKMLLQHLLEDGIYTIQTKRALSNERYIPTEQDLKESQKLYDALNPGKVLDAFNQTGDVKVSLTKYTFPWGRTFECFLDFEVEVR